MSLKHRFIYINISKSASTFIHYNTFASPWRNRFELKQINLRKLMTESVVSFSLDKSGGVGVRVEPFYPLDFLIIREEQGTT